MSLKNVSTSQIATYFSDEGIEQYSIKEIK
jgi:hypothetical protein